MAFESINPATGEIVGVFEPWSNDVLDETLQQVSEASRGWVATPLGKRCEYLRSVASILRERSEQYAGIITREMGKLIAESRAEIEKCAWVCEYYADEGPAFLSDELIETDAGKSLVAYQPLGTVLAVMPWNFPFWQVFRFAAPALVGGNTGLLKHASNVPRCALAIEQVFKEAGLPSNIFRTLMISSSQVSQVIEDERVHAVTLTGSEHAGKQVAACAGMQIKKSVLELGGSDAFIVLEDAELDDAVGGATVSRFLNAGQSCIAAKRFIVVDAIADEFVEQFAGAVSALHVGDPFDEHTTLAPMARIDLRDELHNQVIISLDAGGKNICGCEPVAGEGAFYPASIIDHVQPASPAYNEELFGPVAGIIRVNDEEDAIRVANASRFGLGGSVWTKDVSRGERVARRIESGAVFVNGFVKSDPRLPFGGIKASGYGRELSRHGMREFLNAKTIWIR
ncbi:MAG: NAD-dependent succinate-semialdehyde dehydrogenase [Gammaproteobacteria bacterium]